MPARAERVDLLGVEAERRRVAEQPLAEVAGSLELAQISAKRRTRARTSRSRKVPSPAGEAVHACSSVR